jgi:hypothetical protein
MGTIPHVPRFNPIGAFAPKNPGTILIAPGEGEKSPSPLSEKV